MSTPACDIRTIPVDIVRSIRHVVLRAGLPFETTIWRGDDDPESVHFGAYLDETVLGVASIFRAAPPGEETPDAWQLRGMAVLPEYQNRGYGGALLAFSIEYARSRGGRLLWCNARERARAFYERQGFCVEGEAFEVPGIGLHYRMLREIS